VAAWLVDRLRGEFFNGMKLKAVPKDLHEHYSLMGYLHELLCNREGNVVANREFGMPPFESVYVKLPSDCKERGKMLRNIIEKNLPDTKKVFITFWDLHKKKHNLRCVLFCRLKNNELYKYRINFVGDGAHKIETWGGKYVQ